MDGKKKNRRSQSLQSLYFKRKWSITVLWKIKVTRRWHHKKKQTDNRSFFIIPTCILRISCHTLSCLNKRSFFALNGTIFSFPFKRKKERKKREAWMSVRVVRFSFLSCLMKTVTQASSSSFFSAHGNFLPTVVVWESENQRRKKMLDLLSLRGILAAPCFSLSFTLSLSLFLSLSLPHMWGHDSLSLSLRENKNWDTEQMVLVEEERKRQDVIALLPTWNRSSSKTLCFKTTLFWAEERKKERKGA